MKLFVIFPFLCLLTPYCASENINVVTTTTSKPTIELVVPAGSFDGDLSILKSAIKMVLEETKLSGVISLERLSDAARKFKLKSGLLRDDAEAIERWAADLIKMEQTMERQGVAPKT